MGRKPRFCCVSDSEDLGQRVIWWDRRCRWAPSLRWWQPCRGRLCPLLGTKLQMLQTLPASRAFQSCGKQLNAIVLSCVLIIVRAVKFKNHAEILWLQVIAAIQPTVLGELLKTSGPDHRCRLLHFGAIAIRNLRITTLCSIDLHYGGNGISIPYWGLDLSVSTAIASVRDSMVLCGFVVSLQHTATALEGQSLCQLLEEIKNKAGEIGDFRKNQKLQ